MPGVSKDTGRAPRSPRNSVTDRPAQVTLWLRRMKKWRRPVAWAAFAGLVVVLLTGLVHSAAPGGTLATVRERIGHATAFTGLRITNVVIEGRQNTPEPLLWAALGVNKGDPILGFSIEQARERIASLTWVEHATVERRLPGTIVVNLQERRPFAIWQNQGKFVLIDRAGQTVANQDVSLFRHLPLVVGPGAPAAAADLLDALTARPALQPRVMAGVRVAERRWNLHLKNGTDVMLPEGHVPEALDRLMQLQQDHAVLDRPLQAIDMRLPDKLVFRPRTESPQADSAGSTPIPPPPPAPPGAKQPT
jgi:cell division protein FtsQ